MNFLKKFWLIINLDYKKKFIFLILLTFLSTFFEALSLGLVIPSVSIILDPNFFSNRLPSFLIFISNYLNQLTYFNKIIFVLFFLVLSFFLKNLYLIYLYHNHFKFAYNLQSYISDKLIKKYLDQDYFFFLKSNSSRLITNLTTEITNFINGFVISLLYIFTDIILLATILGVIIFLKLYKITFIITLIILFGYIGIKKINNYILQWGRSRQKSEYEKNKILNHLLHGIKEVIIFNSSRFFLKNFQTKVLTISKISYKHSTALYLPKIILEMLGIISLAILIFYLTKSNFSSNKIIVFTGFYIALAYRLIPCFNRIISSYNSIKFNTASLNAIFNEVNLSRNNSLDFTNLKISFNKELNLKNISFKYLEHLDYVLQDVNLQINKGEIIGIFGRSGTGKTTLINIIAGLLKPSSGTISVDKCILNNNYLIRSYQNIVSYVPQNTYLMDDTIKKNIAIGVDENLIDSKKIDYAVNSSGLEEFINHLPDKINTITGERGLRLSGGQRQRLGIARSLYFDSEILIFDEATNALDEETEKNIMNIIYSFKKIKTIFIITHKKEILKNCNKIFSIINKNIFLERSELIK